MQVGSELYCTVHGVGVKSIEDAVVYIQSQQWMRKDEINS